MAYTKILLDTNAYLRLSKSVRPLLAEPFGEKQYALFLHKEIQIELNRSSRIKNKFYWLKEKEYVEERKKIITTTRKEKEEIEKTYDFVWEFQNDENLELSREDIYCIAAAKCLRNYVSYR